MYSWFNKYFDLGLPEPIVEESYSRLTDKELTVWDPKHPKPAGGPQFERNLLQWWDEDAQQQLDSLLPSDGKPTTKTRRVANERESAAYTFGFNPSLFARRVHDILSVIAQVQSYRPEEIDLVGLDGAGPWVAAARAQARGAVTRAAINTGGFRFAAVRDLHDPQFLPGGAKYQDLPGMLAVAAPERLWLAGEGDSLPKPVEAAYRAAQRGDGVQLDAGDQPIEAAAVDWLLNE